MARSRSGGAVQSKIQMILFGAPFTGKSTLALQSAYLKRPDGKPFRVLYIDPESGSIDDYLPALQTNGIDLQNIYIVYTQSLSEVRELIERAKSGTPYYYYNEEGEETEEVVLDADGQPFNPDMIVVDGTSVLNLTTKNSIIEFSKKRASVKAKAAGLIGEEKFVKIEGAGLELKDYQTINFKGQELILDLMGSGKHYIIVVNAANRPGTKDSFPTYCFNKLHPDKVSLIHPSLRNIFGKTQYILLYQEQALSMFRYPGISKSFHECCQQGA